MTEKQQPPNFTNDQTPISPDEPGQVSPSAARRALVQRLGRGVAQRLYDSWAEDLKRVGDAYAAGVIGPKMLLAGVCIASGHLDAYRSDGPMADELARYEGFVAFEDPSGGPDGASQQDRSAPESGSVTPGAPVAARRHRPPPDGACKQDFSAPESGSGTEVATSNSNSKRIRKIKK